MTLPSESSAKAVDNSTTSTPSKGGNQDKTTTTTSMPASASISTVSSHPQKYNNNSNVSKNNTPTRSKPAHLAYQSSPVSLYTPRMNLPPPPPGMTPEMMKQFAAHHQSQMAFAAAAMYHPNHPNAARLNSSPSGNSGKYTYNPMMAGPSTPGAISRMPQGMGTGGGSGPSPASSTAALAHYNAMAHGSRQHRVMAPHAFPQMPPPTPRRTHQHAMGHVQQGAVASSPVASPFGHLPSPLPPPGVFNHRGVNGMMQMMQNHNVHSPTNKNQPPGPKSSNLSITYRSSTRNKGSSGRKPSTWKHPFMEPNSSSVLTGPNSPANTRGPKNVPITNPYGFHYSSIVKDESTAIAPCASNETKIKVVGVTTEQISRAIPKDASAIFHILDRRINFDSFPEDASLYSLLRAWVQDDPYRYIPPPDLESQMEYDGYQKLSKADSITYPRRKRRKLRVPQKSCDILSYFGKKPYSPKVGSINELKLEAIERGKWLLKEARKDRRVREKIAKEKLRKRGLVIPGLSF